MDGGESTEKKRIFGVFFREKPVLFLLTLKNSKSAYYASTLAKQIDCTYSHMVKLVQQMESGGLIHCERQGRLKLLALTKKGEEVAERMEQIRTLL